ncbi:hypothetical protein [uncultured Marixanthomonas sp.]|uniref:hypothetical protein n=1 Tax=uncultured Marixanthomonas sp. TaxID=757245 RepID=UPI0030D7BA86|tara:strand:- start:5422 stop:6123 length:702 start_codon:yes stop_codon:yes gene_type:complete
MKNLFFFIFLSASLISCKNDAKSNNVDEEAEMTSEEKMPKNPTTAESIAYANGFENWDDVSKISFTFNVDRGDQHFERSWMWMPKKDKVKMVSEKDTVNYLRTKMDSTLQKTDAGFINDKYWLLAPFNLMWDEGATFSEKKNVIAPISKDTLNQLTVVYSNDGGYTPGDAYDLYFGNDYKIKEWIYRKGNDSVATMATTWENYKNHNGLEIATMHKDSTGGFKLYFTDISVKK